MDFDFEEIVLQKLTLIEEKLTDLTEKVDAISEELGMVKTQTSKMDSHVDFVNGVYQKVEAPLNYVCDKVSRLIGNGSETQKKLKEIEN
jgi:glycerol-3-phosphate responsive antiterminator